MSWHYGVDTSTCTIYSFLPPHPYRLSHLFPVPNIRLPRPVLQSAPLPPKSNVTTNAILTAQIHPACAPPCPPLSAPADSPCHCESQTLGQQSWAGWSPSGPVFGREGLYRWVPSARRWRDCSGRAMYMSVGIIRDIFWRGGFCLTGRGLGL